jgi:hypothetical protein
LNGLRGTHVAAHAIPGRCPAAALTSKDRYMSSENTVADRLLTDARKKTARQEKPASGKAALIVGVVALLVSPVSILGWIVGAVAVGLGVVAARGPATAKQGKIAIALGVAAILVGLFFFTLNIAMR